MDFGRKTMHKYFNRVTNHLRDRVARPSLRVLDALVI